MIQNKEIEDDEKVKDAGETELCLEILDDLLLYEIKTPHVNVFIQNLIKEVKEQLEKMNSFTTRVEIQEQIMLLGNNIYCLHKMFREEGMFEERVDIQFKHIRNLYVDMLR